VAFGISAVLAATVVLQILLFSKSKKAVEKAKKA
jgi:hypothetical protein